MRIGRMGMFVGALGALALVTATARCSSAQETEPEPAGEHALAAPFVVQGSSIGGGSYLGVYISEVDAEDVSRLGLREERGALVEDVSEEGPAQEAGIQADDVIVEWNGARVESAAQLQRLVKETPAGREVRIGFVRGGDARQVSVTIGERESLVRSFSFRGPDPEHVEELRGKLESGEHFRWFSPGEGGVFAWMGAGRMGIGIQPLGDQLGEYFGLDGRNGVLVTSVREDSPAEEAGLRAGDVVLSVDGEAIEGPGDLVRKVGEAEQGPVPIGILRDRKERTITVELPEAPEFHWEGAPGALMLTVPEAIEGALRIVPEIVGVVPVPELDSNVRTVPGHGVRLKVREPEGRVRILAPRAEPDAERLPVAVTL